MIEMFVRFLSFSLIFSCLFISSRSSLIPNKKTNNFNILASILFLKPVNSQCMRQILLLGNALTNGTHQWAIQMLDATAKPQSGLLFGNVMHVGNYDQCLEIDENFYEDRIQGKYCSAFLQPHQQYEQQFTDFLGGILKDVKNEETTSTLIAGRLSYGFCVPKVCTVKDLENLADILEKENNFPVHFHFDDDYCSSTDGRAFTTSAIIAIVIFSVFAAIVAASTLYEILLYRWLNEAKRRPNLFIAFSVVTNGRKLLSTSTAKDNLDCLDGLRVISMMWIILGHGSLSLNSSPNINALKIFLNLKKQRETAVFAAAAVGVDTFFTISGLLVVYLFMKYHTEGVKFSLPMFYLRRILRLTPSLVMVLLFMTTLLKYSGNGPFWPIVEDLHQKSCEKNWWLTLLYIQNYIPQSDQCLQQGWYLAVDMQMYILSPIIFFPLVKWPKQTIGAIIVFIILNCSYVFAITWKKHLGTTTFDQDDDQYKYLYGPAYIRGTVYLIGMMCGYFVYKTRTTCPLRLQKVKVVIIWLISLSVMIGIIFAHFALINSPVYNVLNSSLFNSLTRVGWSIALSIIIVLCVSGYGGLINSFLSSKIFTVLIRLNYNVYLLHLIVLAVVVAQGRTPGYFANFVAFHHFWGDYIFTLGVAFIWTLAFESPIIAIEKYMLGRKPVAVQPSNTGNVSGSIVGPTAPKTE